jgi:hypothetical protein
MTIRIDVTEVDLNVASAQSLMERVIGVQLPLLLLSILV